MLALGFEPKLTALQALDVFLSDIPLLDKGRQEVIAGPFTDMAFYVVLPLHYTKQKKYKLDQQQGRALIPRLLVHSRSKSMRLTIF